MNDYEELMQAAEPLRRYLEAHCGLTTELLVSASSDVLRCEFGIPFCRTIPDTKIAETALRGCRAGADRPVPDDGRSTVVIFLDVDVMLKPSEAASLMDCTVRAIRKRITLGKLDAVTILNKDNRPQYQIAISSLPPNAQEKYYAQQRASLALTVETEAAETKASKPFDAYTEAEREDSQIAFERLFHRICLCRIRHAGQNRLALHDLIYAH